MAITPRFKLIPEFFKSVCLQNFLKMLNFHLKTTFFTVKKLNEILLPHIFLSTTFKCPYNKKEITLWLKDMDFMFMWQEKYHTRSLRSLARYCICSCHSNIKSIFSRNRAISSIYYISLNQIALPNLVWFSTQQSDPTHISFAYLLLQLQRD